MSLFPIINLLITSLATQLLISCAATQVSVEKANLDVQTKMSQTIFLEENDSEMKKAIYVEIRNTSDKREFELAADLKNELIKKGNRIVDTKNAANYVIQMNILQVGKTDKAASDHWLNSGYGHETGYFAGDLATVAGADYTGSMAAGLAGQVVGLFANSSTKDVIYSVVTDLQIKEKSKENSEWETYQSRVLSSANKVDLTFEEAMPELKKGLTQVVSNIL